MAQHQLYILCICNHLPSILSALVNVKSLFLTFPSLNSQPSIEISEFHMFACCGRMFETCNQFLMFVHNQSLELPDGPLYRDLIFIIFLKVSQAPGDGRFSTQTRNYTLIRAATLRRNSIYFLPAECFWSGKSLTYHRMDNNALPGTEYRKPH